LLKHKPFDYEDSYGVFMRLHLGETYPLFPGDVISLGSKNQFVLERFNLGLIAAPGRRSNMEDRFSIVHDLAVHPTLKISMYGVLDGHGGEWCAEFV